jgi:hypothetical protein
MGNRGLRLMIAIVVPIVVLLVAQWYDAGVLVEVKQRVSIHFEISPFLNGLSLAYTLTGAGAIAIAIAAWWARRDAAGTAVAGVVGAAYVLVGGFLAALPALFGWLALGINGAPTVAPEPIARFLSDRYFDVSQGVTGSVFTLGGVMLVAGVALVASLAVDAVRARATPAPGPYAGSAAG